MIDLNQHSDTQRKRVLVTGATGFIGHHTLQPLLARGFEVHAVTSKTPPSQAAGNVHWHQADLLDRTTIEPLMEHVQPSHLIHMAWMVVPGQSYTSLDNYRWLQSTLDLAEQFHRFGGRRIAVAGSSYEYDQRYGVCSELRTPIQPDTVYGICKQALQEVLAAYCRSTGMTMVWPRIFFVYGPNEHPNRLVSSVIRSLLSGEPARCSHGRQLRDYLHVQDVADGIVTLLDGEAQGPVNIGLGAPVALRDIISRIGEMTGRSELIRFGAIEARANEVPLVVADISRISEVSDWKPRIGLDEGLEATIAWWRSQLNAQQEHLQQQGQVTCHSS